MYDVRALRPYLDLGYTFLPLRPRDKHPTVAGWRRDDFTFDLDAHIASGGNLGVKLGPEDLVIDVDPRNFPEGHDTWLEFLDELPATELALLFRAPWVRTGTGGWHVYLKVPAGVRLRAQLVAFKGIDFKRVGGYVLAAGCIHPNGEPYEWEEHSQPADLAAWAVLGPPAPPQCPEHTLALIRKPAVDPARAAEGITGLRLSCDELAAALAQLDPCAFAEHEDWLQLGMASWYVSRGEGREEFVAWSLGDADYEGQEDDIRERWATWAPDPGEAAITDRTFVHLIGEHGAHLPVEYAPLPEEPAERPEGALDEPVPDALREALEAFNGLWALVEAGGKLRVYRKDTLEALSVPDFKNATAAQRILMPNANGEMRELPVAGEWLKWPGADRRRGLAFDPWALGGCEPPGRRELNLWTGWAVQGVGEGSWALMHQLIRDVVCSGDRAAFDWTVNWLAWLVQRPEVLPEVAIVLRGAPGAGKGSFGRWVSALVPQRHQTHMASMDHLTGRFNAHLRESLIVFADEAIWAANAQGEAQLKAMITEPTLLFEPKGLTPQMAANCTHLIAASNKDWVVPAQLGERRFVVLDVTACKPVEWFEELEREMRAGGLDAMARDLAAVELGRHPRHDRPDTGALVQQRIHSLDPLWQWWLNRLRDGRIEGAITEDGGEGAAWAAGEIEVPRNMMVRTAAHGTGRKPDRGLETQLGTMLREVAPGIRTVRRGKTQMRHNVVPPLSVCRQVFEGLLGGEVVWDD